MIFQELTLENFNSYKGQHTLNLQPETTTEETRPIILIGGLNGGGKTTIIDAIRLALYGQRAQIERRKKTQSYSEFLSQCVCSHAGADAVATIELIFQHVIRIGNIDKLAEIRVQRTWNLKGKDKLQIFLDGWDDRTLTETWDERVESWLPLGLSNLFLFDGEQIKELAAQDTPPPSVATAIRAVLGLELPDRLTSHLEILINQKQRELAKDEDRQMLEAIAQRLDQQRTDLKAEEKRLETLDDELEAADANLQEAQIQFEAEGGSLAESAPEIDRQLQHIRAEAEHHRQNLRNLAADLRPLAIVQPLLQSAHQQGRAELRRQQAQAARDLIAEHDQRLLDLIQTLNLSPAKTQKIEAFLQQENQNLIEATSTESWLDADPETLEQLSQILQHQLPTQIQLAQTQLDHLTALNTQIEALTLKLRAAPSPEDYDRLRSYRDQAQLRYEEGLFKVELSKRHCIKLRQDIEAAKADLKRYGEQHLDQKDTDDFLKSATRAQQTLQAFQSRLTLQKLNDLESNITNYFRCLLHKSSLTHRIMVDQQTFSLTLYDTEGQPIPKHRLSAGEKQLLAIAFLWALASVSNRQLPIAIDTPLSRLDSSHRLNLIEQYFPNASHQMILLSTDTEIGQNEVQDLRRKEMIAREYLLQYDSTKQQTTITPGYFSFNNEKP
ncbi:DNA sulfur modification protein DndD [Phormidium sp. CLA17]|uniref:DNA sulfur modification protein DndD n=1 Tax=Leptolyngbya sp. Cla-17 TaxID=2803751 RepID=UPI001492AAFB|nr:DNA sulfur modification protein DndD [Leptolyngbya sp. Cla-17]MBM0740241.1 DNA sulfur modification protein DndD [Leptolyngbya sp. Cla-17]